MTGSEIIHICTTVAMVQLLCDLTANYFVYAKPPYQRLLGAMERAKWKRDKAEQDYNKNKEKNAKRYQRAVDDYAEVCSVVAQKHMFPTMMSSIVFLILLRILGIEHKGQCMGMLPFVPWNFVTRVTGRGFVWKEEAEFILDGKVDPKQAAAFLFVYLLATFSVKYFVNKAIGTAPPPGADEGLMTIMESPKSKRALRAWGVDPDEVSS